MFCSGLMLFDVICDIYPRSLFLHLNALSDPTLIPYLISPNIPYLHT